jgi:hypothetical protein
MGSHRRIKKRRKLFTRIKGGGLVSNRVKEIEKSTHNPTPNNITGLNIPKVLEPQANSVPQTNSVPQVNKSIEDKPNISTKKNEENEENEENTDPVNIFVKDFMTLIKNELVIKNILAEGSTYDKKGRGPHNYNINITSDLISKLVPDNIHIFLKEIREEDKRSDKHAFRIYTFAVVDDKQNSTSNTSHADIIINKIIPSWSHPNEKDPMVNQYIIEYKIHNDRYDKNVRTLKQRNLTITNVKKINPYMSQLTNKGPTIFSFNPFKWVRSPVKSYGGGGKRRKVTHKRLKRRRTTRRK